VASARERGLTNISFHASVPKERMPAVWSLCNLGLVHLKREELFTTVIPSKIFECFGMGVPVLFAGPDGEGSQIVTECDAGVVTPAEDADALAQAVERLVERPQELARLARNARQAARMFDRKLSAQRMVEVLARAADGVTPDELRREQPSNASSTKHAA
jgi:glycosyltransferase involved in cell wall biosynthesis